ncbi:rraga protein [Cantharellus anzutake]|uniref:rraga protein n=1 Tax=Cantharellus anzutake TaxID=1750568 RepID=UPI00190345F6|nr:rraga protein [Cantharellus anzutake]KAF8320583.1 rraga protein [Cantharellus anzutake]
MRSIIFSNNLASATSRFGPTIDVEMNHVRFFGSLTLNLWDCGGQEAFMDSFLASQRNTVFRDVGVLIYVFDIETKDFERDVLYYIECLEACKKNSPEAGIFVLIHKMDLVYGGKKEKDRAFGAKKRELDKYSGNTLIRMFATSIWDESLYKAWSRIVHTLIPNAPQLSEHLTTFCSICSATEVVLFERNTFLIIARSGKYTGNLDDFFPPDPAPGAEEEELNPGRFEKMSELIKTFKHSCSRLQEQFHSLEIRFSNFTAVLELMTSNTYVMAVVADTDVQTATLRLNIRLARERFEELQQGMLT